MDFEWDETKRRAVIQKHAVDFVYAALIFDGYTLTWIDDRKDYGEERKISIGLIDEECFVVV
ncbi:BrnT family toxin [Xanthobacter dioxanivorans]|uniref:BrnT family toxin n=1 Tax=Xanthobacter dioxanivorans TaxID=2528964 RepID=A0A974PSN9_9HYPH|nr:BrnT family toxin [Xanthobacter dioxanivorans]QRG08736.1 BrnT family toxin [Xanthobacter dioxanivorans]